MDYNDLMEMEYQQHQDWVNSKRIFDRKEDKVFVGNYGSPKFSVPRWYKIRRDTDGREYIMWRDMRLNLDEIKTGDM